MSDLEMRWREFRAQMNVEVPELLSSPLMRGGQE
jgi:hypothetical protein